MTIINTPFIKQPSILPTPSPFYVKSLNPPFQKNFENSNPPLYREGGPKYENILKDYQK